MWHLFKSAALLLGSFRFVEIKAPMPFIISSDFYSKLRRCRYFKWLSFICWLGTRIFVLHIWSLPEPQYWFLVYCTWVSNSARGPTAKLIWFFASGRTHTAATISVCLPPIYPISFTIHPPSFKNSLMDVYLPGNIARVVSSVSRDLFLWCGKIFGCTAYEMSACVVFLFFA